MRIFHKISTALQGNTEKYLTKGAGVAGMGLVGYESHNIGKMQADLYASESDAKNSAFYLNNTLYSNDMSLIRDGIKNSAYEMELDQGWRRFFNLGIGYVKGFTSMLVSNVIPFGLGAGALFTKGKTAKLCAGALGIYALGIFIKDFFALGTPKGPID